MGGNRTFAPGPRCAGGRPWSLTSLREKLMKIAGVSHGHYVTFRMTELAV
jgi:hypothetical protein